MIIRPITLVGPVEPLIRLGLVAALAQTGIKTNMYPTSIKDLCARAQELGARAIVTRRDEVVDLVDAPRDVLVIGVGSATQDVLLCRGDQRHQVWNPQMQWLVELIRHAPDLPNESGDLRN